MLLVEIGFLVAELIQAAAMLVVWLALVVFETLIKCRDVVLARRSMQAGVLYCERGHPVPVEGVHTCAACGFVWEGSIWRCPSADCGAATPWVHCTCGLSVRSPYRYGGQP